MKFDVTKAHPIVLEYLGAKLAKVELDLRDQSPVVAGAERTDQEGLIYPVGWQPTKDASQLEQVLEGRRISTVCKHHGFWQAFIHDINDEPQYLTLAITRGEAALRCAVLSEYGPVVEISDDEWPDLAMCLQAADPAVLASQQAPVLGSYSGAALQGALFPMLAWEIVETHEDDGSVWFDTRPVTVEQLRLFCTTWMCGRNTAGREVAIAPHDMFLTQGHAQAVANVREYDLREAQSAFAEKLRN